MASSSNPEAFTTLTATPELRKKLLMTWAWLGELSITSK
jgi:hypothetical protein